MQLRFAVCVCVLVSFGCDGQGGPAPDPEILFAQGTYEVGHRELEVTYRPAGSSEDRTLPVRVWYPAAPGSGAGPAQYVVAGIVDLVPEHALDAPPVADGGPFPVVVYSHGSGGDNLLAYPYAELFASHGWVLVSAGHVGNTAHDGLEGSSVPYTRSMLTRPLDVSAVLDWLESGLAGDPLEGVTDTSRVFLFGHSFGGYTTLAAAGADVDVDALVAGCAGSDEPGCVLLLADPDLEAALRTDFGDPRIDAIGLEAPGLVDAFGAGEIAGIEVPAMLMSGRLDQTTPYDTQAAPAWAGLDGTDDLWVDMPMGAHYSFITICTDLVPDLLHAFRPEADMDGCGPDFIPTTQSLPVLAAYLLGFARWHVLGEEEWAGVLEGPPLRAGFETTTH